MSFTETTQGAGTSQQEPAIVPVLGRVAGLASRLSDANERLQRTHNRALYGSETVSVPEPSTTHSNKPEYSPGLIGCFLRELDRLEAELNELNCLIDGISSII